MYLAYHSINIKTSNYETLNDYTKIIFHLSKRLLEATKDENVVRSQDLFTVVRYVSYNPLGQAMAWDWTTLNWDYLVNRLV